MSRVCWAASKEAEWLIGGLMSVSLLLGDEELHASLLLLDDDVGLRDDANSVTVNGKMKYCHDHGLQMCKSPI
jgi:hypothetical protein